VGDLIAVAPPVNAFPLRLGPAVFVAGGIGITPILAMIRAKVAEGAPWV
jgi:ferredoxin-NADP reductase